MSSGQVPNPEQHVLDEIDRLAATDGITELVDWQIEQGIRCGDAPAWMYTDWAPVRIDASIEVAPETIQQLHGVFVQIGEQLRPIVQSLLDGFRQLAESLASIAQQLPSLRPTQPTRKRHGLDTPARRHTPPYPVLPYRDPRPVHQRVVLAQRRRLPPARVRQAGRNGRGRR